MTIDERLAALRKAMKKYGLDAYLVPSSDPHQSEYVADHWKAREWLSGFTGSAGTLIVTEGHAGLWTDSRYFLQAERELADSEVALHKQLVSHAPEHITWLADTLPAGSRLGCDGFLFSLGQMRQLEKYLSPKEIAIHYDLDLVVDLWTGRPELPAAAVFEHPVRYAGKPRLEKMDLMREQMKGYGARHYLVTTLDDIAWLLNLRGEDVPYNPLFVSYLLLQEEGAVLFVDTRKVPPPIAEKLRDDGIALRPYAAVCSFLEELPASEPVLIDPRSISVRLYDLLSEKTVIRGHNIPRRTKALKTATEVAHIRRAMVKDGVSLVKLYRWLEATLEEQTVTEFEVARQLDAFRRAQGDYYGESFPAIVGYNANGAIVHYRPDPATSAPIRREGILLLDSGGQYVDGTTDITRTVALGTPTDEQRRHFTLVLKGHIALARARFPVGTTGMQLDVLARAALWEEGLNYGHGTGHGVGFFLNVHEPPQGFAASPTTSRGTTELQPGMLTSNEPGFYKDGAYGIRTENLVLCTEGPETDYGAFLQFESLSLFPIDRHLIEPAMLTAPEREWLNEYHQTVFDKLSPRLEAEEVQWLKNQCRSLD